MYDHLTEHVLMEGALLDEYTAAAQSTNSKAFAYLVDLLVQDERRHHQAFTQLASSLRTTAELSGDDPEIPRPDFDKANVELLEVTRQLLAHEKADAAQLKQLRSELRDFEDTTLWGLLTDIMRRDTDKHIAILRYVEKQTKRARRGTSK